MANPNVFLSSNLVRNIKLRALVPANQITFLEDDFIALLNSELFGIVVPLIMKHQEEFYVTYVDITAQPNINEYAIPDDAAGMKIRSVSILGEGGQIQSIPRLTLDQLTGVDVLTLSMQGFYVKGNKIVLYPTPTNSNTTIRVFYYKRPNRIVKSTACAQVNLVDSNQNILTLSNTPTDWGYGNIVHTVSSSPMFDDTSGDMLIDQKSGFDIVVDNVIGVSRGDYVALKGESPFAHIPVEGYPLLEQAAVVKVLEGLGDREGMQAAQTKLAELVSQFPTYFSPRVDGNPQKAINRNSISKFTRR